MVSERLDPFGIHRDLELRQYERKLEQYYEVKMAWDEWEEYLGKGDMQESATERFIREMNERNERRGEALWRRRRD